MAEELEIKLSVEKQQQAQALEWFRALPSARHQGEKLLVNRYFDTPDADLNSRRIALRVRQRGDQFIQTLKTQGDIVDGIHRRQEWEWPLPSPELDLTLLADTPLAELADLSRLACVFETNFTRQVLLLDSDDTCVEVAVDAGEVRAGNHTRDLCEIEFELKSGDAGALMVWAKKLANQVPVFLNFISKAEQGYFVAGLHQPDSMANATAGPIGVHDFLRALGAAWLTGKTCPITNWDLTAVRAAAERIGQTDFLEALEAGLAAGDAVPTLARSSAFGQFQLDLVTS